MLLTIQNPDHINAKVFAENGDQILYLQYYDTVTRIGRVHSRDVNGKFMFNDEGDCITAEVHYPNSWAELDGKRLE